MSTISQKSFHYIGLLKAVMRLSVANMKAADVKDVASSITAIANEKLKAEKEAAAGKKKSGTHNQSLNFVLFFGFDKTCELYVFKLSKHVSVSKMIRLKCFFLSFFRFTVFTR